mgnify:CR=1 FL=1
MKTYRNTKTILLIFILGFIYTCESENKTSNRNIEYPISCLNENAINFFKDAELKKLRGDLLGAKTDYESALRIDPSFIMAALNINEPNDFRKKNFLDVAIDSQKDPTEFEKILIDFYLAKDNSTKIKIADSLISRFPNISEPLFIKSNLYGNNRGDIKTPLLRKAAEINPNSQKIQLALFRSTYNIFSYGASNLVELSKNIDSINKINLQINKIISLDTLNAAMYRTFGDIYRYLDLKKCSDLYNKGLDVCNNQGNSFRAEMLITVSYANYLNGGKFSDVLSGINQAIESEFDPLLKMKRYFQYHIISMFEKDYVNAIAILDKLEKDIRSFDFTPSLINETKVSIYNYRSIAHAVEGNENESLKDLELFKKFSNLVLQDTPNLDGNYITKRNRTLVGIVGGLDDRLIMATKKNQIYFEIFVNILNNNSYQAIKLMNNSNYLSPIEIENLSFLNDYKSNNFKKILNSFDKNQNKILSEDLGGSQYINSNYKKYIYANVLHKNNYKTEHIKEILKPISDIRGFAYGFNFFLNDSKKLYNNL